MRKGAPELKGLDVDPVIPPAVSGARRAETVTASGSSADDSDIADGSDGRRPQSRPPRRRGPKTANRDKALDAMPSKKRGASAERMREITRRRVEASRGSLLDPFAAVGVLEFFDRFIEWNELNQPFRLATHQREILDLAFRFDAAGRLAYTTFLYSEPKKGGKTTLNAGVVVWWAFTQEAPNQLFIVANDLDQAKSITFKTICALIENNPALAAQAEVFKTEIRLTNGTLIRAIATDFAGAAGSNHGLVLHDEIWGSASQASQRLYDELTPVPTRRNSIRLVSTYAGFTGESDLLWRLYLQGVGPEEHPDGQGTQAHPELPVYVNREARQITYWSHTPRMPWQTEAYYAEQKRSLLPAQYLRLHENRWTTSETRFITPEMWEACVDRGHRPLLPDTGGELFVGVDIGIKHDSSAVVAVMRDHEMPTVALHRIWKPTAGEPVRLEDVIDYILELKRRHRVKAIVCDPNQMLGVIQRLREKGLPIREYPQTSSNLTMAGQALYDLIRDQNLRTYGSPELREHILNAAVVESSRGWRLAKDQASKKIDAAVALAMALVALHERPAGFVLAPLSMTKHASGEVFINGQRVGDGRRGMSLGYDGPDAGSVHPHERAVDMTPEADRRMGVGKAESWRKAWQGHTAVKPDRHDPYATCARCGMRLPASFQAQHHRESPRCRGSEWRS